MGSPELAFCCIVCAAIFYVSVWSPFAYSRLWVQAILLAIAIPVAVMGLWFGLDAAVLLINHASPLEPLECGEPGC